MPAKSPRWASGRSRLAVGGIDIGDHRRIAAAPRAIIAGVGPELAGLGPPAPRIEHRCGRLVGEQSLGSSQPFQDMIAQGPQIPGCPADPIGQRRAVELDALPGVDLGLPVQWQVIGVLGDQHLGDQRLGRNAAFDDPRRRRRLDHRALARAAAVARPAGDQHPEAWSARHRAARTHPRRSGGARRHSMGKPCPRHRRPVRSARDGPAASRGWSCAADLARAGSPCSLACSASARAVSTSSRQSWSWSGSSCSERRPNRWR